MDHVEFFLIHLLLCSVTWMNQMMMMMMMMMMMVVVVVMVVMMMVMVVMMMIKIPSKMEVASPP